MQFMKYLEIESHSQNIAAIQSHLEDYVLKQGLRDYNEIHDPEFRQFAKHVSDKKTFFDLCKHATSPKSLERNANDQQVQFFKSCKRNKAMPMSFLQKIQNKSLNLKGYRLTQELCKALRDATEMFPNLIDSVVLENNGIKDDISSTGFIDNSLSIILQALNNQTVVKKFVCVSNEFTPKCFYQLHKLLERKSPNNIQELRLSNCKLTRNVTEELLDTLTIECQLKKLSLINANISCSMMGGTAIGSLKSLIENSNHLIELDLSWNELKPAAVLDLSESLLTNRKIQYLNLSWNSIKQYNHPPVHYQE